MAKQKKPVRHIPKRTCIGCRETLSKKELMRIVRTPEGVVYDPTGKAKGRGAYLHDRKSCWERALQGSLSRALKVELTKEDINRLKENMEALEK